MSFGVAKIKDRQAEPVFRGHSHDDYLDRFSGVSTIRYLDHVIPRLDFMAKAFLTTTRVEMAWGDVFVQIRPGRSSVHGIKLCLPTNSTSESVVMEEIPGSNKWERSIGQCPDSSLPKPPYSEIYKLQRCQEYWRS